jgi:hypothetical protein
MNTRRLLPIGFFLALISTCLALPASCAHFSPSAAGQCLQDSGASAAAINAVNDILDGDNRVAVLEQLAIVIGPDVLKCILQQITASKAATPAGSERARRAREYLDSHGGTAFLFERAGGGLATPAARVGASPPVRPATTDSMPVVPAADEAGAIYFGGPPLTEI